MCVLLCANLNVCELMEVPLAQASRLTLQLNAVCSGSAALKEPFKDWASEPTSADNCDLDEAAQLHVMKRSAWLQAYFRYHSHRGPRHRHTLNHGASSRDWRKALEAIEKTWGRLLSLIGLRR